MRHSFRNITAVGFLGWAAVTLAPHGCSNRLGPVRASQNVGGIGRPTLPDITIEQAKECMADDGWQLPPGLVELTSTVEVDESQYKLAVNLDGVPHAAPDFAACLRNVLHSVPIAEEPLQEGVATLQYKREHAVDSQEALRQFIEVIPGMPIVQSELLLQADGRSVLLPVTIKVVDKQVKQGNLDKVLLAKIGQLALDSLGYDEIISRAKQVGWIKTVRKIQSKRPAEKGLIAQSETEVVIVLFEVFTEYAVTAGVVSQLDSPLPGPADIAAIGILAIGLYKTGALAVDLLRAATAPAPTASAPPPAPRKYPNQTCEDVEMARLEAQMHKLCDGGYAATCGGKVNKNDLPLIPCSAIKLSILQRRTCLAARWEVQNKCFDGKPDDRHKKPIEETQGGIDKCENLKLINCATGHPMAEK